MPQDGSATSSQMDLFQQVTLTSDPLPTCSPLNCEATDSAISSPALAAGPMPCASPDGPMIDLFGQAVAPVSPSPSRANKKALTIRGTSGRSLLEKRTMPKGEWVNISDEIPRKLGDELGLEPILSWGVARKEGLGAICDRSGNIYILIERLF